VDEWNFLEMPRGVFGKRKILAYRETNQICAIKTYAREAIGIPEFLFFLRERTLFSAVRIAMVICFS